MIVQYNIWDEIILSVEEQFGYGETFFRPVKVTIVGHSDDPDNPMTEYLCYVPQYEIIKESFKIADRHLRWWGADKRFLGEQGLFIAASARITKHIPAIPGERCTHCLEFIPHASKDSDQAYRCRACHENPYR